MSRYDEGNYFPSGLPGRDERREEDWIENPAIPVDPPQNFIEQERTTETLAFLEPIIRDTTVNPILEPFLPKQVGIKTTYNKTGVYILPYFKTLLKYINILQVKTPVKTPK